MIIQRLRSLLGRKARLLPFEAHVLQEVKSRLEPEAARLLEQQIAACNVIQRHVMGKEVNFYHVGHGASEIKDALRFPEQREEALLATVRFAAVNEHSEIRAEVWLVRGWLFSLSFNRPPKDFIGGIAGSIRPAVKDVKVWFDPMRQVVGEPEKKFDPSVLSGWIRKWYQREWLEELKAPLEHSEREHILLQIGTCLPKDYLDLTALTEGAKSSACTIMGLHQIQTVPMEDANYYVIAEFPSIGVLAVKSTENTGELYLLTYEDETARRPMGRSFVQALQTLVRPNTMDEMGREGENAETN